MTDFNDVLLGVWREVCRHLDITESAALVAARLADHLPLGRLLIRRLDLQHTCLETVADVGPRRAGAAALGRTALNGAELSRILAWSGRLATTTEAIGLRVVEADGARAELLAGPLSGEEGRIGVLAVFAAAGSRFAAAHVEMVTALLEPFAAALENDARIHEIAALREAAEADRRSLLSRLGRRELVAPVVGAEVGLREVMDRVGLVAPSDVPVLLLGETGTGKEVVARQIHTRSARSSGPFIRVNCGAIPSELIDSQLFGHERGSFTGAAATHRGWFERADRGTLLLDEIGELPPPAQVRLLRVLQDGVFERVGGQAATHVDVRIVAATHRDLPAMVRAERFREDLWYRLAVFPIRLPPLRERVEDIAALACHFAERAATRFGLPLVMPTPDDIRRLGAYRWPGNVRELASVIDRAALLGNGRRLEVGQALGVAPPGVGTEPLNVTKVSLSGSAASPAHSITPGTAERLPRSVGDAPLASLDAAVREHIEAALRRTRGRVNGPFGAAALLRVNPYTLRSRMRKLGISWEAFRRAARESSG